MARRGRRAEDRLDGLVRPGACPSRGAALETATQGEPRAHTVVVRGPLVAAGLAVVGRLPILHPEPEPDAASHVASLEALRDGRPVGVEDLRIDGWALRPPGPPRPPRARPGAP